MGRFDALSVPSCEIVLHASADFLFCSSFGLALLGVFDCFWVEGHSADRYHVQGFVEASVTAPVEPVSDRIAR